METPRISLLTARNVPVARPRKLCCEITLALVLASESRQVIGSFTRAERGRTDGRVPSVQGSIRAGGHGGAAGLPRVLRGGLSRGYPRSHRVEPRAQIAQIANKNQVYWGFGVQMYADLSRNDPRGARSAGSTAGSTRRTERKEA